MSQISADDVGKVFISLRCFIGLLHLRISASFQLFGLAISSLLRRALQSRTRYYHFALQLPSPMRQHLTETLQMIRQSRTHWAESSRTRLSLSAPCCRKKKVSRLCNGKAPSRGRAEQHGSQGRRRFQLSFVTNRSSYFDMSSSTHW